MALQPQPFDAAEFLTEDETIAEYLTASLESDDPKILAKAIKTAIRALRMRRTDLPAA